jgi:hypothetical protein
MSFSEYNASSDEGIIFSGLLLYVIEIAVIQNKCPPPNCIMKFLWEGECLSY